MILKVTNLSQQRPGKYKHVVLIKVNIHSSLLLLPELSVHEALYYEFYNYSTRPEVRLYAEGEKYYALVKFKK